MKKIAILGGGIGGLTLANAFQKYQIGYQLFEAAPQFGEVGAGIGISKSTLDIFSEIGIKESVVQKSNFIKEAIIVDEKMNTIRKLPLEDGGLCIHRAALIEALSEKIAKVNVQFNHRLKEIKVANETNLLIFENGNQYEFETVVACDGINSITRKTLFPSVKKRYSGQTIWRGIAACQLPKQFDNVYYEFWGDNLRFAIIPMNKKEYYWYAVKWAKSNERENANTVKQELKALFKNYIPEVSTVIDSSSKIIRDDMWDLQPGKRDWYTKNVVLLGDAIHATTPNLAQGGCQAVEDAITLSKTIQKYGATQQAFEKYQNLRTEKVNYIVNQSWKYGKMSHQSNLISAFFMKTLFRNLLPKWVLVDQYNRLIDLSYLNRI